MKRVVPYLFFNGNCRDALDFYQQCFGGELQLMTYGDAPVQNTCPEGPQGAKDEIMHGCVSNGDFCLMASDWPGGGAKPGNNAHLNVECETLAEIERLFEALGNEGRVTMALHDAFWGARFGMLIDKFGTHWMLNCPVQG